MITLFNFLGSLPTEVRFILGYLLGLITLLLITWFME